jgi:hypothetical protein
MQLITQALYASHSPATPPPPPRTHTTGRVCFYVAILKFRNIDIDNNIILRKMQLETILEISREHFSLRLIWR